MLAEDGKWPKLGGWKNSYIKWEGKDGTVYFSVPFTWFVKDVVKEILALKNSFFPVEKIVVGGPGAVLMKEKFEGLAEVRLKAPKGIEPVTMHNPDATFTTRGCTNKCKFCAVKVVEPGYKELKNFRPAPIIQDNNLIAASKKHIFRVVDVCKQFPLIDFNGGFEAKLFTKELAEKFAEVNGIIRFALDDVRKEKYVVKAIENAKKAGFTESYIRVFVLFGFKDTLEDTIYRLELLRDLKVLSFPMQFQPLNAVNKGEFLDSNWDRRIVQPLKAFYSNQFRYRGMTFKEFIKKKGTRVQKSILIKEGLI